ncbi:PQQ-binding-like beta-propeller repeat protein [Methanococcoides sp. AM1]|uniref:outer membrane protein assembly factor BamB family protein n=1 Tax=Methanococcoides sp. AM1 TaxID=1201011 RepID=UPI001AEF6270|nr:PQQ-binding-like beta-propeller repeat protein [Methanococcoides sp. AM1]
MSSNVLATPAMEDEWHQYQKNAQHIGFTNSDAPDTNTILWTSNDIGAISGSSPAVAEGKVYVNCGDAVKILDMYNGTYLGNADVFGSSGFDSWTSPSYHGGRVWCGHPTGVNGGTLIADGKYYHGDYGGYMYHCYNESTDTELWSFYVNGYSQGTPAYSDNKVYFTGCLYQDSGYVYCVDADTGSEIWSKTFDSETDGTPTIHGNTLYVTTYNWESNTYGDLIAMDKNTGEILWSQTIQRTDSAPSIAYGNVYVSGGCYAFSALQTYCFNATTGELVWSTEESGTGLGDWKVSPVVADGKVFVGKADGSYTYAGLYALDAFTGETVWAYARGGSSPAISDGIVFTVGKAGKVTAYAETSPDLETSTIVQSFASFGQSNNMTVQIKNNGNVDAGSFEVMMLVDGVTLDTKTVSSLAKTSNAEVTFEWTPAAEGEYELQIALDTLNSIDERDEANNYFAKTVTSANDVDWNPWNNMNSDGAMAITTPELQEGIYYWLSDLPAPVTGEVITTERLQQLIYDWLNS